MQLTITLDPHDEDDVQAAMNALKAMTGTPSAPADKTTGKASKPAGKKAADKKNDATPETPTAPPPEPEPAEPEAPTYTLEQVRDALKSYAALEGKDAAIAILKKHGASAISELDADKYEAAMKDAGAFED